MTTLSQSLTAAADKADAEVQEAIAAGNPEWAEAAMRRAAQFRRLATNHRAQAILSGDPADDPRQITDPAPGISGSEIAARRAALGLTQQELANALTVGRATVARWEAGDSPVAHPGMLRLALDALAMQRDA